MVVVFEDDDEFDGEFERTDHEVRVEEFVINEVVLCEGSDSCECGGEGWKVLVEQRHEVRDLELRMLFPIDMENLRETSGEVLI